MSFVSEHYSTIKHWAHFSTINIVHHIVKVFAKNYIKYHVTTIDYNLIFVPEYYSLSWAICVCTSQKDGLKPN